MVTKDTAPDYSTLPTYSDELDLDTSASATSADPWIEAPKSAACDDHEPSHRNIADEGGVIFDADRYDPLTTAAIPPNDHNTSEATSAPISSIPTSTSTNPSAIRREESVVEAGETEQVDHHCDHYLREPYHEGLFSAWVERHYPSMLMMDNLGASRLRFAAFLFMLPFIHVGIVMYKHSTWEPGVSQANKLLSIIIVYISIFGCISAAQNEFRIYFPFLLIDLNFAYGLWVNNASTPSAEPPKPLHFNWGLFLVGFLLFVLNAAALLAAIALAIGM